MKIPKYWAMGSAEGVDPSGKVISFDCWGWSDKSEGEAARMGRERAVRALEKKLSGQDPGRYSYGQIPLREEIVETVRGRGKDDLAVITRNSYGALVLNAANTMFIDIDFKPKESLGIISGLKSLFGKKSESEEQKAIHSVVEWADRHRDLDVRCYRTFAGLRCIVTNQTFDPEAETTLELMRELDCDPLYITLCKRQQCFRARLTPKPWRIKMSKPPGVSPFQEHYSEKEVDDWRAHYGQTIPQYTVCKLVKEIGSGSPHRDVAPVIAIHDRHCLTGDALPLA